MLKTVFNNLDRWRHLPAYQLERRADIFFSVYLKDVVEEFTGTALEETILPELPIQRQLIWPEHKTNKSVKVDYALFSKDRRTVYFVELKTDAGSRREEQDHYLTKAAELGFAQILHGLKEILLATSAHQKYHHLASALADLGFLTLPADMRQLLFPEPQPGLTKALQAIRIADWNPRIEVIYLQPTATDGDRSIDFERFAAHVSRYDDELSRLFAHHLREWTQPAGQRS